MPAGTWISSPEWGTEGGAVAFGWCHPCHGGFRCAAGTSQPGWQSSAGVFGTCPCVPGACHQQLVAPRGETQSHRMIIYRCFIAEIWDQGYKPKSDCTWIPEGQVFIPFSLHNYIVIIKPILFCCIHWSYPSRDSCDFLSGPQTSFLMILVTITSLLMILITIKQQHIQFTRQSLHLPIILFITCWLPRCSFTWSNKDKAQHSFPGLVPFPTPTRPNLSFHPPEFVVYPSHDFRNIFNPVVSPGNPAGTEVGLRALYPKSMPCFPAVRNHSCPFPPSPLPALHDSCSI